MLRLIWFQSGLSESLTRDVTTRLADLHFKSRDNLIDWFAGCSAESHRTPAQSLVCVALPDYDVDVTNAVT